VLATTFESSLPGWYDAITLDTRTGTEVQHAWASGEVTSVRGTDMATITPEPRGQAIPLVAIDAVGGGDRRWGGVAVEIRGGAGSLAADGQLYVGTTDQIQRYDTTTPCNVAEPGQDTPVCSSLWARPVGGTATPVVIGDDDTVHAGSSDGTVYALRTDTGGVRWQTQLSSPVTGAPALADGMLYAATADGRLSAFPSGGCGAFRCPVAWNTDEGSAITVQPVVAGGVVYVGSADGSVRAFDAAGCGISLCRPLWTANAGAAVDGGLAVHAGRLYVATADALFSYGLPAG
jgi:outer membrane protein assembly factor BamB